MSRLEELEKAVEDAYDDKADVANRWLAKWGYDSEFSDAECSAWLADSETSEADLDAWWAEDGIITDALSKLVKELEDYKKEHKL
tara:strand:- start:502 stop:756 length:255 start_codon:yes stop_codon:yes gene_type:complete